MDIKVGDRIRVTKDTSCHGYPFGTELVVVHVYNGFVVPLVRATGDTWNSRVRNIDCDEFVLVSSSPTSTAHTTITTSTAPKTKTGGSTMEKYVVSYNDEDGDFAAKLFDSQEKAAEFIEENDDDIEVLRVISLDDDGDVGMYDVDKSVRLDFDRWER